MEKKYIISEEQLKELLEDSWYLTDLRNAGVDNWEGIDYLDELDDDEDEISTDEYIKENFKEYEGE